MCIARIKSLLAAMVFQKPGKILTVAWIVMWLRMIIAYVSLYVSFQRFPAVA